MRVVSQDEQFILMALAMAQRRIGSVEPNPAVGCVIVKSGQIIGKGWHKEFGSPHAEINAIEDCKGLAANPRDSTMYVTLEPCCHEGKTGPCTKAIIAAGVTRVVVATVDPSPHANGQGLQQLREAGIETTVGICEPQARLLNAPFFKFIQTGKTWVVLKWAQSLDGKMSYANPTDKGRWISGEIGRSDAHRLRRRTQAILVGVNTVIADNPLLIPRPSKGRTPLRIVLDRTLRLPAKCRLVSTARKHPLLICANRDAVEAKAQVVERLQAKGVQVLACPTDPDQSNLRFVLDHLGSRGIQQLLVEGGPTVLGSFLKERLADEVRVYIAPKILGGAGAADVTKPLAGIWEEIDLHHVESKSLGTDVRISGILATIPGVSDHDQGKGPDPAGQENL